MEPRSALLLSEFIIFVSLLFSAYHYAFLPDRIAVHWNAEGEPNGYLPKQWILIFPVIYAGLILLVWGLPFLDPLRQNVNAFRRQYDYFVIVLALFLSAVQILTIAYNIGWIQNMVNYVILLVSVLLLVAGYLTFIARPNWFIGFRTPWTLSSERSWTVTNRLAGIFLMILAVLLPAVTSYFGPSAAFSLVWMLIGGVVLLYALSYFVYRQDSNRRSTK